MKLKFVDFEGEIPSNIIKLGYSKTTELHLDKEARYIVYAIMIWQSVVHYLIIPSGLSIPYWIPSEFFNIEDPRLPKEWYFRYFGDDDPSEIKILMGYKEMVLDVDHYLNLIERESDAIRIFLDRKREIDEEL